MGMSILKFVELPENSLLKILLYQVSTLRPATVWIDEKFTEEIFRETDSDVTFYEKCCFHEVFCDSVREENSVISTLCCEIQILREINYSGFRNRKLPI